MNLSDKFDFERDYEEALKLKNPIRSLISGISSPKGLMVDAKNHTKEQHEMMSRISESITHGLLDVFGVDDIFSLSYNDFLDKYERYETNTKNIYISDFKMEDGVVYLDIYEREDGTPYRHYKEGYDYLNPPAIITGFENCPIAYKNFEEATRATAEMICKKYFGRMLSADEMDKIKVCMRQNALREWNYTLSLHNLMYLGNDYTNYLTGNLTHKYPEKFFKGDMVMKEIKASKDTADKTIEESIEKE